MTPFFLILELITIKVENSLKVNPSTPRPGDRGFLTPLQRWGLAPPNEAIFNSPFYTIF
jgi:hypothetical protein